MHHGGYTAFALLLFIAGGECADSEGTLFVFNFARNFASDNTDTTLSVTIINRGETDLIANIVFYQDVISKISNTTVVTVKGSSFQEVILPSQLAWRYDQIGFVQEYDTRVFINTSNRTTILANNYNGAGQGDTFIVLPKEYISMAPQPYKYAVSVPRPSKLDNQYTIFTFIPQTGDTTITVYSNDDAEPSKTMTLKFMRGNRQYYYGVNAQMGKDPVIYVVGDKPFTILVTVTCATTATQQSCDHASFMPHPVQYDAFSSSSVMNDAHPTDLLSSQLFYITPPLHDTPSFHVMGAVTSNNNVTNVDDFIVSSDKVISHTFPQSEYGDMANIQSSQALIQVTRVGGVPKSQLGGVFLDIVPSITQFLNADITGFVTRNDNDKILMLVNAPAYLMIQMDGVLMNKLAQDVIFLKNGVDTYFSFIYTVPKAGFHKISFSFDTNSHQYSFYVTGNPVQGCAYGYLASFNRQKVEWLPNVSTPSTTTAGTTTGPITTTAGSSSTVTGTKTTVLGQSTMSTGTTTGSLSTSTSPIISTVGSTTGIVTGTTSSGITTSTTATPSVPTSPGSSTSVVTVTMTSTMSPSAPSSNTSQSTTTASVTATTSKYSSPPTVTATGTTVIPMSSTSQASATPANLSTGTPGTTTTTIKPLTTTVTGTSTVPTVPVTKATEEPKTSTPIVVPTSTSVQPITSSGSTSSTGSTRTSTTGSASNTTITITTAPTTTKPPGKNDAMTASYIISFYAVIISLLML